MTDALVLAGRFCDSTQSARGGNEIVNRVIELISRSTVDRALLFFRGKSETTSFNRGTVAFSKSRRLGSQEDFAIRGGEVGEKSFAGDFDFAD